MLSLINFTKYSTLKVWVYTGVHSFLERFALIYAIQVPMMIGVGFSVSKIAFVFSLHEFVRIIASFYSGAIAHLRKPTQAMMIGLLLKCFGCLLWLCGKHFSKHYGSYAIDIGLISGNMLLGCGAAFMMSKVDPYMYILLKQRGKKNSFSNLMFLRNIARQIGSVVSGFVVLALYPLVGFNGVIIITIVFILLPNIVLLLVMEKDKHMQLLEVTQKAYNATLQRNSIKQIINAGIKTIQNNNYIAMVIFAVSIINASFFLVTDINKIVFANLAKVTEFAKLYSLAHILPIVISLAMLFLKKRILTGKLMLLTSSVLVFLIGLCGFIAVKNITLLSLFYLAVFPIFKVGSSNFLNKNIATDVKFIINGLSESMVAIINIIFFSIFCVLNKIFCQQWSVFITMSALSLLILTPCINKVFRKNSRKDLI
ncbi:MAG: hypothetical protein JJW01_01480 [Alphaproteobacteria bacterium]|nr:hypothetical protein [Rickettsiales bacterium]